MRVTMALEIFRSEKLFVALVAAKLAFLWRPSRPHSASLVGLCSAVNVAQSVFAMPFLWLAYVLSLNKLVGVAI